MGPQLTLPSDDCHLIRSRQIFIVLVALATTQREKAHFWWKGDPKWGEHEGKVGT